MNVEGNVGLNAGVRDAIRHRDGLRESGASWEEVKGADGYVQELLKENRCRQWRDLLDRGASSDEMWKVVRGASRRLVNGGIRRGYCA